MTTFESQLEKLLLTDPALMRAAEAIVKLDAIERSNRLAVEYYGTYADGCPTGPYDWQYRAHLATKIERECGIIAANQVGKTRTWATSCAIWLTGLYPKWWPGRVFPGPVKIMIAGITFQKTRDVCQADLLGPVDEDTRRPDGTGWIPPEHIGHCTFRQCGLNGVIDKIKIRHVSGGWSYIQFMAYEMGHKKFQGDKYHVCWGDEEPEPKHGNVWAEFQTRTLAMGGLCLLSRTPLDGYSDIIEHFYARSKGVWYINAGWKDAPHLSNDDIERMKASYPEHEVETRMTGEPKMGSGGVYAGITKEMISIPRFDLRERPWLRVIAGHDFGMDHPAATVWIAIDEDRDIIYVWDAYKIRNTLTPDHAKAIKSRGEHVPVAWPHDGMKRDTHNSGQTAAEMYRDEGVNMLPESARYEGSDKGGSQAREPITWEIVSRCKSGRLFVFEDLDIVFDGLRKLRRENGKIVDKDDDVESALRYAVMDRRYAEPIGQCMTGRIESRRVQQSGLVHYDPLGAY